MTILQKLFGTKKSQNPPTLTLDPLPAGDGVAALDKSELTENQRNTRLRQRPTVVREFLEKDYWQSGYNHALSFPSAERKQAAMHRLEVDYRFSLQRAQQLLLADTENHEQEKLQMNGISVVLDAQLEQRSRELRRLNEELALQLELSVDKEGWLAPALAAYEEGFMVGSMKYLQEKQLLGGLTTMH
ncbi:MAG: hypothetical protein EAY75_10195 [Bacteroidetes bacterium]|nr:MAG: hypothetical protein EAY75_10195 [Bacteroidota bacterium]